MSENKSEAGAAQTAAPSANQPANGTSESKPEADKERRSSKERKRSRSPARKSSRSPRRSSRSPRRDKGSGDVESCKLYIGNISYKADDRDMRDAFSKYGKISDVLIPMDRDGRQRGFCFVTFESERDADDALKNMDGREIDGRALRVSKARSGGGGGPRREGGGAPPRGRGGGSSDACRDFARGSCTRGDRCRFGHGGSSGGSSGGYDNDRGYPPRYEERGGRGGYDNYDRGYDDRSGGYGDRR